MALRRGFKTEANHLARELRHELGKAPWDPLCPWELAKLLEIPVISLTQLFKADMETVSCLLNEAQTEFSAISVFKGRRRVIVHNDAHHPYRQAANIAHELSHAILLHPPTPPFNDSGERNFSDKIKKLEEEASWLGPALLVSEEAALHIVKNNIKIPNACEIYNASKQLINMRLNVTGARKRASYRKRR